jgi:replication factor A1
MSDNSERSDELVKIGDLTTYSRGVNTVAKVISKTEVREVTSRSDGSSHRVCEALIADETGSVYMSLWDDNVDNVVEDQVLQVSNGYINLFRGSMRLNIGKYGSYEEVEEAPFADVNLDNNLSSRQYDPPPRGGRDRYGRGQRRY